MKQTEETGGRQTRRKKSKEVEKYENEARIRIGRENKVGTEEKRRER